MTHQVAVTITVPVVASGVEPLKQVLRKMREDPAGNPRVPLGDIAGLHFARLVLLEATSALDRSPIGPTLVLLLDCDAPANRRLGDLVRAAGAGLDDVFGHCEGYPSESTRDARSRYAYLRGRIARTDVSYVNTLGRPLSQIRDEAALREAIETFLDDPRNDWTRSTVGDVRDAIRSFVASRSELRWALRPAPRPSLSWRLRERGHLLFSLVLIALLSPLALAGALPFAVTLRRHEKHEPAPRLLPNPDHVARLAADEDHFSQNQFTAVGHLRPGGFRKGTAIVVLWLVNLGTRHIYNRGALTGVRSIHAARWFFLDGRRRLVFASNYDGSLENYMDDFIDKVAWGLNAVFSNGLEYPRTNWLVRDGARDELAFKSYIRTRQVPTDVWYTAYPDLTTVNIANNARIRAGLSDTMDDTATAAWLRLF